MLLKARLIQTFFTALVMGFVYFRLDKNNYLSKNGASTFMLNNQVGFSLFLIGRRTSVLVQ